MAWLGREYDVVHVTFFEMIGCDAILWRCESFEVWQCNALLRFIMWEFVHSIVLDERDRVVGRLSCLPIRVLGTLELLEFRLPSLPLDVHRLIPHVS